MTEVTLFISLWSDFPERQGQNLTRKITGEDVDMTPVPFKRIDENYVPIDHVLVPSSKASVTVKVIAVHLSNGGPIHACTLLHGGNSIRELDIVTAQISVDAELA